MYYFTLKPHSADNDKHSNTLLSIIPIKDLFSLTFDIPQGEGSIAGGFRSQGEVEPMSRLWFIFIQYTDVVNYLGIEMQPKQKTQQKDKKQEENR